MMGEIRRLYREACEEAVAARENVLRARLPVESTQLALQNQTYERNHLVAEVERCRAFRSIYQDAELHTVDEFFALAPPEETDPSVVYDEHSTMIARLKFELSERERCVHQHLFRRYPRKEYTFQNI
ncbi:hypothetical protein K437DRAFT_221051 [Tilletiaria anomala UBC 951]|uniref:Uncharacterized protein n=1 Tax=Tilletiaria anomala (strain ATCC 24038 / CBS 436.72 / UBC 951) TaxID=1037660 RepID=A0A066WE50_TILAU|nr:uncharacterized protein K437DRAFT_221051 [Tilletiaria anomala UBC 951]KDN52232.1 hypothetical protein K437DRAFT_221051 [Tilletiaria anomala UBC 951]